MNIMDFVKKSFIEGYASMDLQVGDIMLCMLCTVLIAMYVYVIYKEINKKSFYSKNFNMSLVALAIITAAIILTIQSNIVVSLGMVGALSIVRFRTAVKDPLDLVFLFWAISVGIICGAGFALIAIIASLVITLVIVLLANAKEAKGSMILVVNADDYMVEEHIMQIVEKYADYAHVKARNVSQNGLNMAIEIRTLEHKRLVAGLMKVQGVLTASLVDHEGDVTV